MSKILIRIVAYLLFPCLIADPAFAASALSFSPDISGVASGQDDSLRFSQEALDVRAIPFINWITHNSAPKIAMVQLASLALAWVVSNHGHPGFGHGIASLASVPFGGKRPKLSKKGKSIKSFGTEKKLFKWLQTAPDQEIRDEFGVGSFTAEVVLHSRLQGTFSSWFEFAQRMKQAFPRMNRIFLDRTRITMARRYGFDGSMTPQKDSGQDDIALIKRLSRSAINVLWGIRNPPSAPGYKMAQIQRLTALDQQGVENAINELRNENLIKTFFRQTSTYFKLTTQGGYLISVLNRSQEERARRKVDPATPAPGDQSITKKLLVFIFLLFSVGRSNSVLTPHDTQLDPYRCSMTLSAA
jgi:hypothetical protein